MALGDIYRLTRSMTLDGVLVQNVMHFRDEEGTHEGAEEALWEHFDGGGIVTDSVNDEIRAGIDGYETVAELPFNVQRITAPAGEAVSFNPTSWTPGTGADGLPTFCAVVFQVRTGFASRSKRGRFYLAGISESYTQGNVLVGQGITNAQNVINSMEKYFMPGGAAYSRWTFGVWSRLNEEFTPATALGFSTTIAVMRSRKLGYGA